MRTVFGYYMMVWYQVVRKAKLIWYNLTPNLRNCISYSSLQNTPYQLKSGSHVCVIVLPFYDLNYLNTLEHENERYQ